MIGMQQKKFARIQSLWPLTLMSLDGWMPMPLVNEHNEEQEDDIEEQEGDLEEQDDDYYGEQNDDLGDGSFV